MSRHAPARRTALRATLVAMAGQVVLTRFAQAAWPLTPAYPFISLALLAATSLVAWSQLSQHQHARLGVANGVTLGRLSVVTMALALLTQPAQNGIATAAVLAIAVALLLDGVDGALARRSRLSSEFGARFDMETDALLVLTQSLLAWQWQKAGAWVILGGLLRYLYVAAGRVWPWLAASVPPRFDRKAICVIQVAGMCVVLWPAVVPPASTMLAAALLALLSYSFLVDIVWLWRRRV